MTAEEIVRFIEARKLPLSSETKLQVALAGEFDKAGIVYEREVRLSKADRIDFMVGDVGLEIKIKGQRREIYRQCERYSHHERVRSIVLATNASMGMPATINMRPVFIARLGIAWL